MPKTQLTTQADLSGGFNPTTDPFKTKPNEWIVANNVIVSKPGGDNNGSPTTLGSIVTRPLMRRPPSASIPNFAYPSAIPSRQFIARLDSTENWTFLPASTETAYFSTPISQGNNCIEMDSVIGVATDTFINNLIFKNKIDITDVYGISNFNLSVDATESSFSGTGTLSVYLYDGTGKDALYSYTLNSSAPPSAVIVLPFISATSGFDKTNIVSISVQLTMNAASYCNIKLSDLRFENLTTTNSIVAASAFGQGANAISTSGGIITNLLGVSVMCSSSDALFIGTYPFSYWIKLKTGLTNVSILQNTSTSNTTDAINGTRLYFAEFPNPNDPQQNIMGIADGADDCFTYDPNAQPGYQFSQLIQIQNNVQLIVPSAFASSGSYTLTLNGNVTSTIEWNASEADIQSAIVALPNVGVGNAEVNGNLASQSAGSPSGYTVTFGGNLSGLNPGSITVTSNSVVDINSSAITFTVTSVAGSYEDATPASGSWCYQYGADVTAPIAWNADASTIASALNALASITAIGSVSVQTDLSPQVIITFTATSAPGLITVVNNNVLDANGNQVFLNPVITTAWTNSGPDEIQQINANGSPSTVDGGAIELTFNGQSYISVYTDKLSDIQAGLIALSSIGGVGGTVTVSNNGGSGSTSAWIQMQQQTGHPIIIEFGGALGHSPQPLITISNWGSGGGQHELSVDGVTIAEPTIVQTQAGTSTGTQIETTTFSVSPNSDSVWRYLTSYKNMMILSGNDSIPMTLRPSQIDDYTNYQINGTNDVTLNGGPGERITGTYDMGQSLIITTNSHIWNLYGSNPDSTTGDFSLIPSESLVGCIEMGAGIRVGPGIYFYSGDDIFVYQAGKSTSLTSGKMKQIFSQIPESMKRAVTVSYDSQRNILIWYMPQLPANTITLFYIQVTFSLDTGSVGIIGDYGISLINSGNFLLSYGQTGQTYNMFCGVDMTSDGSTIRPVFFGFGDSPYEFDPPSGTATNLGGVFTVSTAFNFCKSPMIIKDFMRVILQIDSVESVDDPTLITVFFMSDGNTTNIRQVITGLQPRNGKIDVLLNGVVGQSISVGVQGNIGNADNSPVQISGYLAYWQAIEDL